MKKPKILFYDIETRPLAAWVWRLGDQTIRHGQLMQGHDQYGIICICYCWNDGKPAKSIDWGVKAQNSAKVVKEFDKIIKQADVTIGKNSDRFDVKQINTQRLLHDLPPVPEWTENTDDVEKQLRKFFYLPSFSLDYFSKVIGNGGKNPMELKDWVDIVERKDPDKLKKMIKYCKKDVVDTRAAWNKIAPHVKPRLNMAAYIGDTACKLCGSKHIVKDGTRILGKTRYQKFHCNNHGGYAGKAPIHKDGKLGKIG